MAVGATPQDHPDRAGHLNNLGIRLGRRFERTGSMDDLNRSISSFEEGWHCRSSPPSIRIRLAQKVAAHFSEQSSWARSSTLLEEAVELLPTVSLRSLQHTDKQHELERFAGLASMAAATALNAGKSAYHALKLLELGRGVIAGLLLEMRSDVSELEQRHPQLAEEFVSLRDELDSSIDLNTLTPIEDAHSSSYKQNRRWAAEKRIEEVLAEIRLKDGFQNFLLPPTEDELKRAASAGPIVVVNVSPHRCDAFLVHIESHVKSLHTANSYRVQQMLEWLWDVAARPVLEALNLKQAPSDDDWPRIWWIPTGQLGQLPLHAAGRHSKSSADTVLDRAISSYSSSIKALVYGRRQHGQPPAKQAQEDAVLITVPDSGLHFARQEVEMLEKLCPSLKLNPKKPAAKREEILAHLRTGKIFHFASHGRSNPSEPSESCLVLGKDEAPITVANLRDCRLQESSPFLAYLSACSTKVNQADTLADEEIHLVSACQLAGFRHVIGTLWEVSDKHCVDVAHDLYTTLAEEGMTDMAICRGLHRAIRELRNKDIEAMQIEEARADGDGGEPRQSDWGVSKSPFRLGGPLLWAAYVHAGL
ncbi:hypothetical protein COCMIDRAFT_110631 [Bipolaris oryzae ATCC 44560]|uniref:CHAT domain-containing protein n=1 Tax=Bipolaris oryzae ATCC 44560 TaxID=930090 RepID=W6Z7W0_COCMI|nr:uncharacterized protein COCMIDRAFT_110631 [Bipolaris oryzae ATCC 44560]EUC39771.1 hypothetical protein COCMIDRAFT_110631 [Bipolaris oryzae ATCC 44560]